MSTVAETISFLNELSALLREKNLVKSTKPIENIVEQLEMWTPGGRHPLRYSLRGLEFTAVEPQYIRGNEWSENFTLKLDVDVTVKGDAIKFDEVKELTINVHYDTKHIDGKACKGAWHLDLHVPPEENRAGTKKKKAPGSDPRFMHPDFHFHHGGKKLDALGSYGNVILLDSPRVMHHPLDVFLAIDFVISNFVLSKSWQSLRDEVRYKKIIETAQGAWWKPYYEALGNYWASKAKPSGRIAQNNMDLSKKLNPHLF